MDEVAQYPPRDHNNETPFYDDFRIYLPVKAGQPCACHLRENKQKQQRQRGYEQGVFLPSRREVAMQQRVDGTLRSAAGTLVSGEAQEWTARKKCRVTRVEIEIYADSRQDDDSYNQQHCAVHQMSQLKGIPVKIATGAPISPSTNATMHHILALSDAFSAPS